MTRSTHQVAAFAAALGALVLAQPLLSEPPTGESLSPLAALAADLLGLHPTPDGLPWPTATFYLLVALLGGIAPDLDKPGHLWARVLTRVALGGHRHLSHSLLGASLAAVLFWGVLTLLAPLFTFPVGLLWLAFVAGYLSHLAMDTLTLEGVPWLFPWQVYVGLPPFAVARIRTGSLVEQLVVMPILLTVIGWLGYRQGDLLTALWR